MPGMIAASSRPTFRWPGMCLSLVAGFVDACGFVALFGLFTAHVTGNFIMIGVQLAAGGTGVLAKLLALPVFVLSIAVCRWLGDACVRHGVSQPRLFLLLQIGLLAAFMFLGLLWPPAHADGWHEVLTGLVGVCAMSVQNAHSRLVLPPHLPTTVMTGTVTQIVIDGVDLARGRGDRQAAWQRLSVMAPALLAFACGAIAGAAGYVRFGFVSLLVPLAVLGLLLISTRIPAD